MNGKKGNGKNKQAPGAATAQERCQLVIGPDGRVLDGMVVTHAAGTFGRPAPKILWPRNMAAYPAGSRVVKILGAAAVVYSLRQRIWLAKAKKDGGLLLRDSGPVDGALLPVEGLERAPHGI